MKEFLFLFNLIPSYWIGLGNAFLSHIKACDGIFHMVRIFDEVDIIHVEGNVDPIRDIEIIHDELR
jgi:obg-like ATPase 1